MERPRSHFCVTMEVGLEFSQTLTESVSSAGNGMVLNWDFPEQLVYPPLYAVEGLALRNHSITGHSGAWNSKRQMRMVVSQVAMSYPGSVL